MYHSVFFGDKNTWDDWHIVPTSRPVIKPPTKKTNYLDIPGSNGVLDLSESLTGYPVYNNREGSIEFFVMNGYQSWEQLYSNILEHLGGKHMRMILEDDDQYFYEGVFEVEDWQSTVPRSTIIIKYNVNAYKWNINKTIDDWLWDTFSFEYGKIQQDVFSDISVDSDEWIVKEIDGQMVEYAPICPEFIVESDDENGIDILYKNKEYHLSDGTNSISDFILYGETSYSISFKGHGTVSINFRSGRL